MIIKKEHGAGGEEMDKFLHTTVLKNLLHKKYKTGLGLDELDDAGTLPFNGTTLVFTTDAHTVDPTFFPGGDIGKLAVCGTINDLAVMGATPLALSNAMVLPEGIEVSHIDRILQSMDAICEEAGVSIICGDTKVAGDFVIVTTAGIGVAEKVISDAGVKVGDAIIVSGTIGDHGIAIMSHREGISFETALQSDVAPLNGMISKILCYDIHAMKDPTRGGLAKTLNEFSEKSGVGMQINEETIPVRREVRAASEMLGLNYYEIACEGKAVIACAPQDAEEVVKALRSHAYGRNASIIGEVMKGDKVLLKTRVGGRRVLEKPVADPVPRVC
ncbi:MAG: hydrogenase expression/formation protein HypE [Theionarchaea archaeon]|nr:hydrogenase expression/formation protein HypE [Theionarchaea archaeon]MBU7000225.1 hydrogenase expression/formation protein HypE [Theionarchaea archaeon]MBU7022130.1 hydrogenase expression/formation protein HypE [Theionarchaea archaeon]MBU7036248.1 hydrogenase expression/formation protein HypE [Theionarchaea archaeon]MBU7041518.1 hydrogenase expression/formation protein HypE [Theionarchaea archaeon]